MLKVNSISITLESQSLITPDEINSLFLVDGKYSDVYGSFEAKHLLETDTFGEGYGWEISFTISHTMDITAAAKHIVIWMDTIGTSPMHEITAVELDTEVVPT